MDTINARDIAVNDAATATIEATYHEMHTALVATLTAIKDRCPHVTAVRFEPSDQGDWFATHSAHCPMHGDACPVNQALEAGDLRDYAHHIYTTHTVWAEETLHMIPDTSGHLYTVATAHLETLTLDT